MNALIQEIARQGLSQEYYNTIGTVTLCVAALYGLWHGRKLGIPLWKMVIILLAVHFGMGGLLGLLWDHVLVPVYSNSSMGISALVNSIVRVFAFVPLICLLLAKLLKLRWGHICDAVSMFLLLRSGLVQISCIFTGCCHGYEVSWGLYSPQTGEYHVPVPIIETVLTLTIFGVFLYKIAKSGFQSDGTHMPRMLICYGAMRFVCEVLRDNAWIIFGCSAVALHALFLCVMGIVWLCILRKAAKKQTAENAGCAHIE